MSILTASCKVPTKDPHRAPIHGLGVPGDTVVEDTYFVVFDDTADGATVDTAVAEAEQLGATIRHEFKSAPRGFSAKLPGNALGAVLRHPKVSYLEVVRQAHLSGVRVCPDSWGLDRINQKTLPLDGVATDDGPAGAGVTIFVVDSGVRRLNRAFGGPPRIDKGLCTVAGECGMGGSENEADWTDCGEHGTFSAAIAAGSLMAQQAPPGKEIGIASKASIFPVRVASCVVGEEPNVVSDNLAKGLESIWNKQNVSMTPPPAVVLISAALIPKSPFVSTKVDALIGKNAVVVVAAGNNADDACRYAPGGSYTGGEFNMHPLLGKPNLAITVGALARPDLGVDERLPASNHGDCVDVWAPGHKVISATNEGCTADITTTCGGFGPRSGTSFAAAHVAGVVAGLWSKDTNALALSIATQIIADANTQPSLGPVLFSLSDAASPDTAGASPADGCVDGVAKACDKEPCEFCPSQTRCCDGLDKCGHGLICEGGECSTCGGAKGEQCCKGDVCRADLFACDKNFNICSCGQSGEPCCGGKGGTCEGALECINGSCDGCGLEGLPCCAGVCTGAALDCVKDGVKDVCVHCGFPGETCCDETCFYDDTTCDSQSRICTSCGAIDSPCCGGQCLEDGATCTGGKCVACGKLGTSCCEGACLGDNLSCVAGQCTSCGFADEPCCNGLDCGAQYACIEGTCKSCGGVGQPCCAVSPCESGSVCTNDVCSACGGPNEPCCPGNSCDPGSVCTSGTCAGCQCAGGTCCADGCHYDVTGTSCAECKTCDGAGSCSTDEPNNTPCTGGTCQSGVCSSVPPCAQSYWQPTSMWAQVTGDATLDITIEEAGGGSNLTLKVCKESVPVMNTVIYVQFQEWYKNNGLGMFEGSLAQSPTDPACWSPADLMFENTWSEGEGLGGEVMIVSPASCAPQWGWTCANNPGCGSCWFGNTQVMTRTCL